MAKTTTISLLQKLDQIGPRDAPEPAARQLERAEFARPQPAENCSARDVEQLLDVLYAQELALHKYPILTIIIH